MAALKVLQFDMAARIEELDEQLNVCDLVRGRARTAIRDFLLQEGIYSIEDITDDDKLDFKQHLRMNISLSPKQRQVYLLGMESLQYSYYAPQHEEFLSSMHLEIKSPFPVKKAVTYLLSHGITSAEQITYDVRAAYEKYLIEVCETAKVMEYVKVIDHIKLDAIRQENEKAPFKQRKLSYYNGNVFLLYHPDYRIAWSFQWLRDKSELVFDFSLPASNTVKEQVFFMLNYVMEKEENVEDTHVRHDRRERFLIPLKMLYLFCVDQGVDDIEKLLDSDLTLFRERLKAVGNTKEDTYMQVVDNIRKFLFLKAKKTNWEATVWYMERFHFQSDRMNPSNPVVKFSFTMLENESNRRLLQSYMKYMLGVTDLAIGNIRFQMYYIIEFLKFCEAHELGAEYVVAQDIEDYTKIIEEGVKPDTYNGKISCIYSFYRFLLVKQYVKDIPFILQYYLKETIPEHHNRSVPEETVQLLMSKLKYFPEDLRLMYLHLWSMGLRLNEVCTIKSNAYYEMNGETWLRIYQNKMKMEKVIPIPAMVFQLMRKYIKEHGRQPEDYVFQGSKGGAFRTGTFCKQMKEQCIAHGIDCGDYIFRSHDYRHSVATAMSDSKISVQAIRDFLGHRSEEMTKQYIDFIPERIDLANEDYFDNEENSLASILQARKGEKSGE